MPERRNLSPMSGVVEPNNKPSKSILAAWFKEDKFVDEPMRYSSLSEKPGITNPGRPYPRKPKHPLCDPKPEYSTDIDEPRSCSSSASSISDSPVLRPKRLRPEPSQSDFQTDSQKASEKKKPRKSGLKKQKSNDHSMFEKAEPCKGETVFDITNNLSKLSIDETLKKDKTPNTQKKAKAHRTPPPPAEPPKPQEITKPPIEPTGGESLKKRQKRTPGDSPTPNKKPKDRGKEPKIEGRSPVSLKRVVRAKKGEEKEGDSKKTGKEKEKVGEANKKL